MSRRGVGGASDDSAVYDVRQEMARLPFLSRTTVVRTEDPSLEEQRGPPERWEEIWRVRHERRVTWADGKGGLRPPRRKPEGTGVSEKTGGGRLEISRTISAWHSGRGLGRSDGRGGAALVRSYLATMRRIYQRERPKTRRHWQSPGEAVPCGNYPNWQPISAHFLGSLSTMVACDTIASWAGAVRGGTTGASTRGSSRVGAPWMGRRAPPARELLSRALHPTTWGARATDRCPDLSRAGILRHRGPGVLAWLGRNNVGNDDVRSENCGSRIEGSGHARRLSANLISDKERERPRNENGTDWMDGHWEKLDAGGRSALDTTPCGSVAMRRRYMTSGRGCPYGGTQLGQTICCRASICGCQGKCDEHATTAAEGCRTGWARRRWVR